MKSKDYFQQGFSLLEILIAFSILALSLGILLNIFSGGLRRAMISEEYQQAVVIAQSKIDAAGEEEILQDGEIQGSIDDKYYWRVNVQTLIFEEEGISPDKINVTPYKVTVVVDWAAGENNRQVELTTLKLSANQHEI
jgi:general secretion pathway protein I